MGLNIYHAPSYKYVPISHICASLHNIWRNTSFKNLYEAEVYYHLIPFLSKELWNYFIIWFRLPVMEKILVNILK